MYKIYQLVNPKTNIPYYIGFCKDINRPKAHFRECKRWLSNKPIKDKNFLKLSEIKNILLSGEKYTYEFIFESSSEEETYNKEIELIKKFGRIDIGTGILTNMNDGGKGLINPNQNLKNSLRIRNSKPLEERFGKEKAEKMKQRLKEISNDSERKKVLSDAGKKGISIVKQQGWSKEAIEKRVKTRHKKDNYSKQMDACNTPESIRKRVETKCKIKKLNILQLSYNEPLKEST